MCPPGDDTTPQQSICCYVQQRDRLIAWTVYLVLSRVQWSWKGLSIFQGWLFAGSLEGARRAALLYSLVQSRTLVDVPPFEYLKECCWGGDASAAPDRPAHSQMLGRDVSASSRRVTERRVMSRAPRRPSARTPKKRAGHPSLSKGRLNELVEEAIIDTYGEF